MIIVKEYSEDEVTIIDETNAEVTINIKDIPHLIVLLASKLAGKIRHEHR